MIKQFSIVDELATAFDAVLREWLTPAEYREAVRLNWSEPVDGGVCHSHDHCDANMAMLDAWQTVLGREDFDGESMADCALWNDAWTEWKHRGRKRTR